MNFNFETTAGASQGTSRAVLEGNKIHEVVFKGIFERDIQGVKDASQVYKVLDVKFENENGVFTDTVWEPKGSDGDRRESTSFKGEKLISPSNIEAMMLKFKHIIDAINPELGEQIDNKEKKIGAKDWTGLKQVMVKATEKGIGKTTNIKLIINNKGEVQFPYFANIDKSNGNPIITNNFIGDKLFFSSYEQKKMSTQATAKPTAASSFDLGTTASSSQSTEDVDFDLDL